MNKNIKILKKLGVGLMLSSGFVALAGDMIYGSKAKAEEYLFGLFMINLSTLAWTLFTILISVSIMILIFRKLMPFIIERINELEDTPGKGKKERKH